MANQEKGMLIVISGPAGAGKGTLSERLFKNDPSVVFSVSVTTRQPRYYEQHGVHYYFVTDDEYAAMILEDKLLEHAVVHGHGYGTPREPVEKLLAEGKNVLLDIDPQGAKEVIRKVPDCISIFILPPSMEVLRKRLHTRNTEDEKEIELRLHNARDEIRQLSHYGYYVVNEEGEEGIQKAYETIACILRAEKQKTARCTSLVL